MKENEIKALCLSEEGEKVVLQGNIAFAVGCVRAGIHSADGYPGTPSTEVIDRGLSQVQDMIKVGWSVNEAVATGVAFGHTLAGEDAVVTMKIPGLFQACDLFTSASFFHRERGALIYFIASDFTPSSTQHVIDPRYLFKSCMVPVFEPRNHQEMLEAGGLAAKIGRKYQTPVVIFASGNLCHSEGLVRLNECTTTQVLDIPGKMSQFNLLPGMARVNYDKVMSKRMPALDAMVEQSVLNEWIKGSGKSGVITYGINTAFVREVREVYQADFDILSLAYTHPLPLGLIKKFHQNIDGDVHIIEDGYCFVQEALESAGLNVKGKERFSKITEWSPGMIAEKLGYRVEKKAPPLEPVPRPPMICAGCPYRLFAHVVSKLKKKGKLGPVFGDIGCNALLYFMNAMDTGLAMGASDSKRQGFVLSRPEMAAKCMSVIGDSTECHSGLDATRNAVFRRIPGVKVVLDNFWTAMTGGQPAPSSPVNLAGESVPFNLVNALKSHANKVFEVSGYELRDIQKTLKKALLLAADGEFIVVVVQGSCIKKIPEKVKGPRLTIHTDKCDKCHTCLICSGIEEGPEGFPQFNTLCSGCAGENPACFQMCPFDAISHLPEKELLQTDVVPFPKPPVTQKIAFDPGAAPKRLSLAIRGVGGQGNLFFGRVLTRLAFLAGYDNKNIIKGETHGMAQMGGPVISTFSCGKAYSPVLFPGSVDCLIALEMSELLRPGFMEMLKKDGTVLCAGTTILPQAGNPDDYPRAEDIRKVLGGIEMIELDVMGMAIKQGDVTGRSANVVMIGALSRVSPFDVFPAEMWLKAIENVSRNADLWSANYAAFMSGCEMI